MGGGGGKVKVVGGVWRSENEGANGLEELGVRGRGVP